jgi:hypothetical protein
MVGEGRDELVFTDLRGGVLRNSNWRARVFEPAVKITLDVYADLFDEDLDSVAANLDAAIRSAAYPLRTRQPRDQG